MDHNISKFTAGLYLNIIPRVKRSWLTYFWFVNWLKLAHKSAPPELSVCIRTIVVTLTIHRINSGRPFTCMSTCRMCSSCCARTAYNTDVSHSTFNIPSTWTLFKQSTYRVALLSVAEWFKTYKICFTFYVANIMESWRQNRVDERIHYVPSGIFVLLIVVII